ncbi:hypothetical protein QJQ45_028678, partial [Haematococcus lacustris]
EQEEAVEEPLPADPDLEQVPGGNEMDVEAAERKLLSMLMHDQMLDRARLAKLMTDLQAKQVAHHASDAHTTAMLELLASTSTVPNIPASASTMRTAMEQLGQPQEEYLVYDMHGDGTVETGLVPMSLSFDSFQPHKDDAKYSTTAFVLAPLTVAAEHRSVPGVSHLVCLMPGAKERGEKQSIVDALLLIVEDLLSLDGAVEVHNSYLEESRRVKPILACIRGEGARVQPVVKDVLEAVDGMVAASRQRHAAEYGGKLDSIFLPANGAKPHLDATARALFLQWIKTKAENAIKQSKSPSSKDAEQATPVKAITGKDGRAFAAPATPLGDEVQGEMAAGNMGKLHWSFGAAWNSFGATQQQPVMGNI